MLRNERTRPGVGSMFNLATCVSDACPTYLLYIDSYHSGLRGSIAIIYVEIDHLYEQNTCRHSEFLSHYVLSPRLQFTCGRVLAFYKQNLNTIAIVLQTDCYYSSLSR